MSSRKDTFRAFFFYVQSDKNPFFEVFKVPKTKGIAFEKFGEIIRQLHLGDDFFVCIPIDDIHKLDIRVFNVKQFCDKM